VAFSATDWEYPRPKMMPAVIRNSRSPRPNSTATFPLRLFNEVLAALLVRTFAANIAKLPDVLRK
jgi:hypothetical protein